MHLVFLHGPAAAGKYTVGSELSQILDIPLFHNHLTVDLATSLFEFGSPGFVEVRETVWLTTFREAAKSETSFIFTFQPEASVRPRFIDDACNAVQENGGDILFVELVCPEDIVEARISNESRAKFGKLNDVEFYKSLRSQGAFEFPPMPEPLVRVHTDRNSPRESAEQIAAAVRARS